MPNRLVREGFLDSEAIHSLSDSAECFYHRLMLAADDAGRMDGRVELLRSRLFPLDLSRRASDVEKALAECIQHALVIPYEWKGQRFLQLTKWQRCSPCVTSKYPWRDGSFRINYVKVETRDGEKDFVATSHDLPNPLARDSDGIDTVIAPMSGDGDGVVVGVASEGEGEGVPPARKRATRAAKTSLPDGFALSERVKTWAAGKGYDRLDEHFESFVGKAKAKGYVYTDWDEGLMGAIREDWAQLRGRTRGGPAKHSDFDNRDYGQGGSL